MTIAVRVSRCSSPVSPRVACGVTHTSCASPPIQTAAAVTCRASMITTGSTVPGVAGVAGDARDHHRPRPQDDRDRRERQGGDSGVARRPGRCIAAITANAAVTSMPRPNSRPNRVACSAEPTGPRWSNASQNDTPATSEPCTVSAIQPPPSISTVASVNSWLARCVSRRSAIRRRCGSSLLGDRGEHRQPKHDPADHQQKPGEVGEPGGQVASSRSERGLGGRGLRGRPPLPDAERQHTRDQVPVGGDDPPAHGVVAVGQARLQRRSRGYAALAAACAPRHA